MLQRREETDYITDEPFSLAEMMRAINRSRPTSPGKDQICYVMIKHLGEGAFSKLLHLYNSVGGGKIKKCMEEAIVIPIRKPGKDPSKPTSYRPIAQNICKIIE